VLLTAHYDTVAGSPGAGDDGIGVAVLLETARALSTANAARNTVMILLTDGEETGLLGAEAFVRERTQELGTPRRSLSGAQVGHSSEPLRPEAFNPGAGDGHWLRDI
jgi:Zn-dependent M28 family amino/carboxypeptidase